MTPNRFVLWPLLLPFLCGGATCSSDDVRMRDSGAGSDGGFALAEDSGASKCRGVPDFHVGLQALGREGLVRVEIVDAPPIEKYENDWRVKVTDADGKPLKDFELHEVEPFMPAHGHDGTFSPVIEKAGGPETFNVLDINLWMEDQWEVRFFVRVSGAEDVAVFNVCVPR